MSQVTLWINSIRKLLLITTQGHWRKSYPGFAFQFECYQRVPGRPLDGQETNCPIPNVVLARCIVALTTGMI